MDFPNNFLLNCILTRGVRERVRIGTKYLDQNAKALPDAMFAVKEEKQKLRALNNGFLPDWYSKREFSKRKKKPKIGDELLLD